MSHLIKTTLCITIDFIEFLVFLTQAAVFQRNLLQ